MTPQQVAELMIDDIFDKPRTYASMRLPKDDYCKTRDWCRIPLEQDQLDVGLANFVFENNPELIIINFIDKSRKETINSVLSQNNFMNIHEIREFYLTYFARNILTDKEINFIAAMDDIFYLCASREWIITYYKQTPEELYQDFTDNANLEFQRPAGSPLDPKSAAAILTLM